MSDARLRSLYRDLLQEQRAQDRAACVSPGQLQALAEGKLAEAEALAVADHVMACGHCRDEFALLRVLVKARPRAQLSRTARLALAASIMLIIGTSAIWQALRQRSANVERSGDDAVQLVHTDGRVGSPVTLIWRPVSGATRYEVEIMDSAGQVLHQATVRDTVLVLPETVVVFPGQAYRWWVRAMLPDGRETRSSIDTFRAR